MQTLKQIKEIVQKWQMGLNSTEAISMIDKLVNKPTPKKKK